MKQILTFSIFTSIFLTVLTSCGNRPTENETIVSDTIQTKTNSGKKIIESNNIFGNPNELITDLSKNGIGELKEWSNPMEMGWGSLTDYYQFGPKKDGIGIQNNIAYYIEGTESKATKMYVNLNINNPADKKNALKFLNEISGKTFKTLNVPMPKELSDAILKSKEYKTEIGGFKVSNKLDKSKIETWKVNIEKN